MNETQVKNVITTQNNAMSVFSGMETFTNAMQIATQLSKSDMIPAQYKGKPENCVIALELSNRLNASPFEIMQNTYIVQGKPSWSSQFIISRINSCAKFEGSLKFKFNEDKTACFAYITEKATGEKLIGPAVTMQMAQAEGWFNKNGSKWKTMPQVMLRYRAATFFSRLYCPEIMFGMYTQDEIQDIKQQNEDVEVIDIFPETTEREVSENAVK